MPDQLNTSDKPANQSYPVVVFTMDRLVISYPLQHTLILADQLPDCDTSYRKRET